METHVTRVVFYGRERMFDLVADVERYPEFVPLWQAARVHDRTDRGYRTDQVVRLGPLRYRFSTCTRLHRPDRITVFSNRPPLRELRLTWTFDPLADAKCRIGLDARFDLRSRILAPIGLILSRESIERMIDAFERRARHVYGPLQGGHPE